MVKFKSNPITSFSMSLITNCSLVAMRGNDYYAQEFSAGQNRVLSTSLVVYFEQITVF